MVEPWLRGTLTEVDAVRRQVLHALELTGEDVERWCGGLTDEEMFAGPFGLPAAAFHLRHIARSLDRLLTYAEGGQLDARQMNDLRTEEMEGGRAEEVLAELRGALKSAARRVLRMSLATFEEGREVGRDRLPTTLGGLLVHSAEHTQRHTGQAITTAKVVIAGRR